MEINRFNDFCTLMFQDAFNHISSTDMSTIIDLEIPRASRVLRLLFFPNHADIQSGHLNTKLLEIKPEFKDMPNIPMRKPLEVTVHGQTHTYRIRRNGFLTQVSDEDYCRIFVNLGKHANIPCPTWNHWMTVNRNVADPLRKIMRHVMLWYSRSWKYPAARDDKLRSFNWSTEIERVLFRNAILPKDMLPPWHGKDSESVSEKLLRDIWDYVEAEAKFREPALKQLVGLFSASNSS